MSKKSAARDEGPYLVFVDDNYHYQDESERYKLGSFDTCEAAVAACKRIVDQSLEEQFQPGMTASQLVAAYKMFGEDPFVRWTEGHPECRFSAWTYAEERAKEMCAERS